MQKTTLRFLTAALTLTLLFGLFGCAKPVSCETLAERFTDALIHDDGDAALSLMPEKMLSSILESENQNRQEAAQCLANYFRQCMISHLPEYASMQFYTCRIKRYRDYSAEELIRLNSRYQKYQITADAARELTVVISFTPENGTKLSTSFSLEVFCIGQDWYMNSCGWIYGSVKRPHSDVKS